MTGHDASNGRMLGVDAKGAGMDVVTVNDRRAWTDVGGRRVTLVEGTVLDVHARAHIAAMRMNVPWWRVSVWREGRWIDVDEPARRNPNYKATVRPDVLNRT
jgi:hypothetical protein